MPSVWQVIREGVVQCDPVLVVEQKTTVHPNFESDSYRVIQPALVVKESTQLPHNYQTNQGKDVVTVVTEINKDDSSGFADMEAEVLEGARISQLREYSDSQAEENGDRIYTVD